MTFRWRGRGYDTSEMRTIETGNPLSPIVYLGSHGEAFLVEIDRIDGIELRLLDQQEARSLGERYGFSNFLPNASLRNWGAASDKSRALIVEDDGSSRHALSRLLRLSGYHVDVAATLTEAVAKLEQCPTWLILDLRLPDGQGTALLKRIRSENLPIKVAVTTGERDEVVLSQVAALQPNAIFHKPLDLSLIMHWLEAA